MSRATKTKDKIGCETGKESHPIVRNGGKPGGGSFAPKRGGVVAVELDAVAE